MILTRAPLRMSFFGGGSDIASHYEKFGGAVLSVAINKYMYISMNTTPIDHVKLMYSEIETVKSYHQLKHNIVRNAIEYYGQKHKTGLGSSSTFSVALIQALSVLNGYYRSKFAIAEAACDLEINKCLSPIGKQDQYAASYGGMNYIEFNRDGTTTVMPVEDYEDLWPNLLLFYTGRQRSANKILARQTANPNHKLLNAMVAQANTGLDLLKNKSYDDFGYLLDDAWQYKRRLTTGISDSELDIVYEEAIESGALGGKLLGAGGGGYFLFYVPIHKQLDVIAAMESLDLQHIDFNFSKTGVETLYNDTVL